MHIIYDFESDSLHNSSHSRGFGCNQNQKQTVSVSSELNAWKLTYCILIMNSIMYVKRLQQLEMYMLRLKANKLIFFVQCALVFTSDV